MHTRFTQIRRSRGGSTLEKIALGGIDVQLSNLGGNEVGPRSPVEILGCAATTGRVKDKPIAPYAPRLERKPPGVCRKALADS